MGDGIGDLAYWLAIGFLFLGVTLGPIGRAIATIAETVVGRLFGAGEARRSEELTMLAERVAELQGVEHRVLELEERLDFAERMLARGLPAPGPEADTPPEPVEAAR